jgi:hypothetical protein
VENPISFEKAKCGGKTEKIVRKTHFFMLYPKEQE